ncbi:MAG: hypothetical protein E7L40_03610 [Corynebacterium kroppenstedtii]|uniref:hypothetical protein n=1 Tax=Corynebacterium kroppenstedtii TaxID=161879 RepID=UPI0026EE46A5|nr:hypothetical protein [Corynebacterium kroppenstedtii]MDU7286693.1 hypothetical protein [Corynebacterium kroppenstedtii]
MSPSPHAGSFLLCTPANLASLARKIQNGEDNTTDLARQIERIALQLARELG